MGIKTKMVEELTSSTFSADEMVEMEIEARFRSIDSS